MLPIKKQELVNKPIIHVVDAEPSWFIDATTNHDSLHWYLALRHNLAQSYMSEFKGHAYTTEKQPGIKTYF